MEVLLIFTYLFSLLLISDSISRIVGNSSGSIMNSLRTIEKFLLEVYSFISKLVVSLGNE